MSRQTALLGAAEELLARGPLSEDELARALYGATGSVAPWVKLLRSLLQRSERARRRADGRWELIRLDAAPPVLVAGRTTRARHGRLLALAIAPVDAPRAVRQWRFESETRPARYIAEADREQDDEPAVSFGDAAEAVSELLRDRVVWVLDADLPALLAAELQEVGQPRPWVDVLVCQTDVWTASGRKRSMEAVRASLDLTPVAGNVLHGELEVIARVATRSSVGHSTEPVPKRARVSALRTAAAALPAGPGVYRFHDASASVLYVGSATNLRRRVLSYFGENITLTRGLHGLLERAHTLEFVPAGTHLEAVVYEARLIAALEPPYNVQRRVSERQAWLRIGAEQPKNVVQVASAPRTDRALYLGPLPNRTSVNAVAATIATLWGFSRRGGSARVSEASLSRLNGIHELLEQPDVFCTELRSRLYTVGIDLSERARAVLAQNVDRTERAVLAGELRPMVSDLHSVIVARPDASKGAVSLLLVRNLVCHASVQVDSPDVTTLSETINEMLHSIAEPSDVVSAEVALVARWLHAHRDDLWVQPVSLGADPIANRLAGALREHLADTESSRLPAADEWWT